MRSLTNRQREELYDRCKGDGEFPRCNLCFMWIEPGQKWHVSHNPHLPKALGGLVDGIAHDRCNMSHGHLIDTPLAAKSRRIRQKHIGAWRSRSIMPGSRRHWLKRKVNGIVEKR